VILFVHQLFYRWGCEHEQDAKTAYCEIMKRDHPGFTLRDSGLYIDTDNPFLGASPDGIAQCNCCEERVVEIKCPFCFKEVSLMKILVTFAW